MVFASNQMRIALGWLNDGWVPNLMPDDDDDDDDDMQGGQWGSED